MKAIGERQVKATPSLGDGHVCVCAARQISQGRCEMTTITRINHWKMKMKWENLIAAMRDTVRVRVHVNVCSSQNAKRNLSLDIKTSTWCCNFRNGAQRQRVQVNTQHTIRTVPRKFICRTCWWRDSEPGWWSEQLKIHLLSWFSVFWCRR